MDCSLKGSLTNIWLDILNVPEIDTSANFIELGGDSLLATRVLNRVRAEFGVEIPLWQLFSDESSIDALCGAIEADKGMSSR